MFYVFTNGSEFVVVGKTTMLLRKVKSLEKASYWTKLKNANSWIKYIQAKYPDMELKECILTLK